MKKVSVVVPVYNAEKVIERCLNSILKQTYKNFEIICVNDGSKDNSEKILKSFALQDSRILVFSQENKGPAYTRNFAISKVSGDYLMFCDADDWYEPMMIEKMVLAIQEPEIDIAMCDTNVIDLMEGELQGFDNNVYHKLLLSGIQDITIENMDCINCVLWNKIFKMDLIRKFHIAYPTKYEHDDVIFLLKYMAVAKKYNGVNSILYNYVIGNPTSIMGNTYTCKNKGHEFDFIYSFKDLFNYTEKFGSLEYNNYLKEKFYGHYEYFSKFLSKEDKYKAPVILKQFVKEFKIFDNDTSHNLKKFEKRKFIQKIFSVRNETETHKVLRLLGLKFKFKRRYQDKQGLKPAFLNNNIPIVFNCDDNFIKYLSVAITSIVEHSTFLNNYDIIILHQNISYSKQFQLQDFIKKYKNFHIRFVDVSNLIKEYEIDTWFTERLNITVYYRCLAPMLLKNFDKFIYLDSDIIANTDISSIFRMSFEDKTIIAVKDDYISSLTSDDDEIFPDFISYAHDVLGINNIKNYFNSGVMLINNKKIQKSNYCLLLKNIGKRNDLYFHDQNIFNSLYIESVKYINKTYNCQLSTFVSDDKKIKAKIYHYCSKIKPWKKIEKYTDYIWWSYAKKSPFYEEILYSFINENN